MRRPVSAVLILVSLLVVVVAGCVPASPDVKTYQDQALTAVATALSETATVARVLETLNDGRIAYPTAETQIRYSENSVTSAAQNLTELNPPPESDRLSATLSGLFNDAEDLITEARVTVHRRQTSHYLLLAHQLGNVSDEFAKVEGRLQ